MRRPDLVAAGGGVLLIVALFLPWYSRDTDIAGAVISQTWTGWQATPVISALLFLVGAVAIAATAAPPGFRRDRVLLPLGALALLLVLFRVVDVPLEDVELLEGDSADTSRGIGLYLALLACVAVAFGGRREAGTGPR